MPLIPANRLNQADDTLGNVQSRASELINKIRGVGSRVDPLTTQSFSVQIGQIEQAVFTEFSGLQAEIEVLPYEEGGCNDFVHKLPGRTKFSNITLKRGVAYSDELWLWFLATAKGNVIRQNVSVVLYSADHKEVRWWHFDRAFPVKWVGPTFRAGENAISIETLELAHEGMTTSKGRV